MTRNEAMLMNAKIVAAGGKLYGEKIAVMRDKEDEKSKGGIIIPKDSQRKPLRGRCVMVGLGVQVDQKANGSSSAWHGLAVGDALTFSKYDGTHIDFVINDEEIEVEVLHGFDVYIGFGREEQ